MALHQLLSRAVSGDAITNDALALAPHLGAGAGVWAVEVEPGLLDSVRSASDNDAVTAVSSGPWLVHVDGGNLTALLEVVARLPNDATLLVRHHGLTPAGPLARVDPSAAAAIGASRTGLAELARRVIAVAATSNATSQCWSDFCSSNIISAPLIVIAPPLVPLDEFLVRGQNRVVGAPPAMRVLVVGSLQPHKGVETAVLAHHLVASHHIPEATLALVGDGHSRYRDAISRLANGLRLGPHVPGKVAPVSLAAELAAAAVVLIPSVWEGFGTAALESMAAGVPVIARRSEGLIDTIGGAGLILETQDGPDVWAEAVVAVLSDGRLARGLSALGRERAGALAPHVGAGVVHELARSLALLDRAS